MFQIAKNSVACSQSVSKCSASCSEVSARRKDTVSSTDRIQNDCEDSIASVDKFVCSSVAAASSQDVVCSLDDAYACSDEVVATLQCEQIVDVIAEAVDHVCFTAASLQADVSSPSVYACSSEVSVAERSRRLADCSKEDFVHDFVDRDCSPVIDDVSTEMFACSTGFLSTHCSQRELVDDVQDCVHDDVSTHCSDVVVNDRLAVPVAELQFSRRSCLADSQNEAMFTSDDDCVSVNRRRGIRSRSCSAVTDLEHSRRSNLTDSWNKAVFTPKACSVVGNCCSHSCSRSTRSEADMVDDDCQHVTVEQKLSTNVPVHNQLGEVVDEVSNCSESLQTVQSDVCQVVKQVAAAGTFEHSGTQCSVNAEQLSRDTRQSGSARKCLFTDYYVSGPGQTRNGQLSEDHNVIYIDQTCSLRFGSSDVRNDCCRADQLACDCIAVEPVLELPVIARSRSMQCRDGPGYCSAGHCADICTLYCHDDEICVNNNLTVRDANAIRPARPSVCRSGIGYIPTSPPVLRCRGIYTDDDDTEIEFKATPHGNSVNKGSVTLTTAEANGHRR